MIEPREMVPRETRKEGMDGPAVERRNIMTRELLNLFGMNVMMAEDVNEPSLRIHPHHKIRKERRDQESRDTNEAFLRMLTAR